MKCEDCRKEIDKFTGLWSKWSYLWHTIDEKQEDIKKYNQGMRDYLDRYEKSRVKGKNE